MVPSALPRVVAGVVGVGRCYRASAPRVRAREVRSLGPSPRAELFEGASFGRVVLADVVVEGVVGVGVAGDKAFESAAAGDGTELVVVTDDDDL
ncbi:hypothetical protein BH23ACT2_BH23ACT2_25320 [soil metagenome]